MLGQYYSYNNSNETLCLHLVILLWFRYLIGYQGLDVFIDSINLLFILIQSNIIDVKIISNLASRKTIQIDSPTKYFISSPLGLVPKYNSSLYKIHHLLYPFNSLINNYIIQKSLILFYLSLYNVFIKIIKAKRHLVLIKQDIKDAFWNIFIAPYI